MRRELSAVKSQGKRLRGEFGGLVQAVFQRAFCESLKARRVRIIGVDYGDVTEGLESNGLAAFDASWRELGDQIATQLRRPSEDSQQESKP